MIQPTLYEIGVMALASGRVAFSLTNDEIFRPAREWIWKRSAPDEGPIRLDDGSDVPARMVHGGVFKPTIPMREPGFWGQLAQCVHCVSFWTSLVILLAYVVFGSITISLLAPFALWGLASAFGHWMAR